MTTSLAWTRRLPSLAGSTDDLSEGGLGFGRAHRCNTPATPRSMTPCKLHPSQMAADRQWRSQVRLQHTSSEPLLSKRLSFHLSARANLPGVLRSWTPGPCCVKRAHGPLRYKEAADEPRRRPTVDVFMGPERRSHDAAQRGHDSSPGGPRSNGAADAARPREPGAVAAVGQLPVWGPRFLEHPPWHCVM